MTKYQHDMRIAVMSSVKLPVAWLHGTFQVMVLMGFSGCLNIVWRCVDEGCGSKRNNNL